MESFDLVAMGGTFDIVHKGHMALLSKAFSISSNVIIGLVSDELAAKKGKKPQTQRLMSSILKPSINTISERILMIQR